MKSITVRVFNYLAVAVIVASFAGSSFGQTMVKSGVRNPVNVISAPTAAAAPIFFEGPGESGNPDCSVLNALYADGTGDARFSHIIVDNELKLDFGTPNGTFAYTNGSGKTVVGSEFPTHSVTVSSSGSTVFSWSSPLPKVITAVILKIGSDAYVYPYKPFANSDTNLVTGDSRSISHMTFCFDAQTAPTAADASISGRVVNANGVGLSRAQMVLVNGETGETKITLTSPFGYYNFEGVEVGKMYVLNVSHKQYNFAEAQRVVSLADSATDVNFVAVPVN